MKNKVLKLRKEGIYCPDGDFFRSACRAALITHAHSDHARPGHSSYICSDTCKPLLKLRIGEHSVINSLPFGKIKIGKATVSFHPAGHILGSAQVRVKGVWVSGDYKPQVDQTSEHFRW